MPTWIFWSIIAYYITAIAFFTIALYREDKDPDPGLTVLIMLWPVTLPAAIIASLWEYLES